MPFKKPKRKHKLLENISKEKLNRTTEHPVGVRVKRKRNTPDSEYQEFVRQMFEEAQKVPLARLDIWLATDWEWDFKADLDLLPLAEKSVWLAPDLGYIKEAVKRSRKDHYWKFLRNLHKVQETEVSREKEEELPISECKYCVNILDCNGIWKPSVATSDGQYQSIDRPMWEEEEMFIATEVLRYHESDVAAMFGRSAKEIASMIEDYLSFAPYNCKSQEDWDLLLKYYWTAPLKLDEIC